MKTVLILTLAMALPPFALAQDAATATSDFITLDGKTIQPDNPTELNPRSMHFKEPVMWLLRTKTNAVGTVILCPGGAYQHLEMNREGANTAQALNNMGFDVAVLEYHIGGDAGVRDLALADALKAFRLLKTNAADFGLHPARLDIMGYSAGGHLATRAVAKLGPDEQPDDVILVYPAYLNETKPGTSSLAFTPPSKPGRLFVAMAANDDPGWIKGCEAYVQAWKDAGGYTDFHLLPMGGHGFGMDAPASNSVENWPGLLRTFLTSAQPQ